MVNWQVRLNFIKFQALLNRARIVLNDSPPPVILQCSVHLSKSPFRGGNNA